MKSAPETLSSLRFAARCAILLQAKTWNISYSSSALRYNRPHLCEPSVMCAYVHQAWQGYQLPYLGRCRAQNITCVPQLQIHKSEAALALEAARNGEPTLTIYLHCGLAASVADTQPSSTRLLCRAGGLESSSSRAQPDAAQADHCRQCMCSPIEQAWRLVSVASQPSS